jgi:hypothetical protein
MPHGASPAAPERQRRHHRTSEDGHPLRRPIGASDWHVLLARPMKLTTAVYSGSKAPGFPIQTRHRDGPLRDCDGNRLPRPQRTLRGKRQLDAGKCPFKRAVRRSGSDPKPPFRFLQSSPTLGPTCFRFCFSEAAVCGYRLPARSGH